MRLIILLGLIILFAGNNIFASIETEELKTQAINYYDEGKLDLSVLQFNSLAVKSRKDAFFSLLNIAIIEFERNNLKEARIAISKATNLQHTSNYNYIQNCTAVLNNKAPNLQNSDIILLKNTSDHIQKFLLWKFLYYNFWRNETLDSEQSQALYNELKGNIPQNSVRDAMVLSAQANLFWLKNQNSEMMNLLRKSNLILENLLLDKSYLYLNNVRNLFFFYDNALKGNEYRELLLTYEKKPHLIKNKEINSAINYFKSRYYCDNKDYEQSLYYIKQAYLENKDNAYIIIFHAYIYVQLNDYNAAFLFYKKLKHFNNYEIESLVGSSRCSYQLKNYKLVSFYNSRIVKIWNSNKASRSLFNYNWIAYNFINTNHGELVVKLDKSIIKKYEGKKLKNLQLGHIYALLGYYLWGINKFNDALEQYQLAILAVLPNENNRDPYADLNFTNCLSSFNLYSYLNNKGETFYQLAKHRNITNEEIRDLKECLKNLNLSIEQIYKYKMQLSTEEQMYLFSELTSQKYPNIIKVCLELYNLTGDTKYSYQAFRYAEQGRAAIMLSLLRSNSGSKIGLIPAKYKAREDSLSLKISILQQRLSALKEESSSKYVLNTQIDALTSQRAELEQLYKKQYPSYYNLKYSSETVNPVQFQASLADNECVVEYLLNKNFLISFYIDKKNLIFHTDTLRSVDLSALAERFYNRTNHFSTSSYRPDSIKQFADDAQKLYAILLKPFEQKIKGKKLIVVADNSLRKIPFEVLLTEKPADYTGYRNLPYLIKQNTVYYAPSVTFLDELRKKPVLKHSARLLAVAPVYSSLKLNDTISRMLLAVRSDTSLFGSLPNAKKEIAFAHSVAGGRRLFEKRATETRFKKIAGDYDIIHLATHGILNNEASLQSKLLFSESSPDDDGFLHNYEIYNLKQSSQLVILSACNTGAGKNYGGEGVISTGRGFLSSGSRSVIMTLWPVNDLASFELIKGFYEGLKNKIDISDALRNSKLNYLGKADNMHSHPFFWTGYIIYGDASISMMIYSNKFLYIFLAVGIFLAGIFIWKFRSIVSTARKLLPYRTIVK